MNRDASWEYRNEFHESFARTYFRRFGDGLVSSVGIGTYLGDATDERDDAYYTAVREALATGVNVIDTAINYRHQRSERVVGRAIADSDVDRDAVLLATKGGFVPFDGERPDDPGRYVREEFSDYEFVRGNCLDPDFVGESLDRSLDNLGVESVDLYYLHNPEMQLEEHDSETVYDMIEAAFTRLEERAAAGDINHYGVATWEGLRVPATHESYLSLPELVRRARAASDAAGTTSTHLRALQLPFNVRMADAFTVESHAGPEGQQSALWFAHEAGLDVFASAPLLQGELAVEGGLPDGVAERLDGETTAQKAINFARSAPGVTSALVGMGTVAHVAENVAAGEYSPLGADGFDAVFE
ncbi:aldo/keto reductase [Halosegnis longus]|uniref:Aldo/keto reductase n=1 Tax=Halosegnis longus TaxID=2216012 RepID=A0AAJ4UWK1_9EURY|nr:MULTISPECIES: aldo/keto reductase [Halobacteriales]RNJ26979.1 aldo/keto reductase [Salella cibi]